MSFLAVYFIACGEIGLQEGQEMEASLSLEDENKLKNYVEWTKSVKYVDVFHVDNSVLQKAEKKHDLGIIELFLSENADSLKEVPAFAEEKSNLEQLLYTIDINNDALADVIFSGPEEKENNTVRIFLNREDHFDQVFFASQYITDLRFSEGKVSSLSLINPGYSDDPQILTCTYAIYYVNSRPLFTLVNTRGYLNRMQKVEHQFTTASTFSVVNKSANLRSDCYLIDGIAHPSYGGDGNVIAVYLKGASGKALGYKLESGKEWIYALMQAGTNMDTCYFSGFTTQPTEIYGWLQKTDTDLKDNL